MKDKTVALLLSIFLGGLGIDRFYLGYTGLGILKLLTGGCFGVLWIIDIIYIITGKLQPADGSEYVNDFTTMTNTNPSRSSVYDDLEKAAKLHAEGIIDDQEFEKMKKELLGRV